MQDKCGIVGICSNNKSRNVASFVYYGLYALQHRGQESAGIATHNGNKISSFSEMGLVTDAFNGFDINELKGNVGIGHVRYSTTGSSELESCQPFIENINDKSIAIAHNGDIINSNSLKKELSGEGFNFISDTDSEVVSHLIKREFENLGSSYDFSHENVVKIIEKVSNMLIGSYSLVILINDQLYAVRDPAGMKPLSIGKRATSYMVASETVAFDVVGAEFIRDLVPGEIIYFNNNKNDIHSYMMESATTTSNAHCMFEYVYFARPDSTIDSQNVYTVRKKMGEHLFNEYPVDADVVMPVPDSSIPAAIGFANASGIPYAEGLIKNRYVGRTFIMPTQEERELAVKLKMNPIASELKGKKIVLVDDSIVRGTTSESLIGILRKAGAKEIHMRIGCPPVISPCYYGVAMATKKELIAANLTVDQIKDKLGVDSLGYLSIDSLIDSVNIPKEDLCLGCVNEEYPTEIPECLEGKTYYKF
ncbi:MAG: amidophosphoribosyltransferase [Methanobacteriaceae archaeon]